jgi:hypothetical protein
MNALDPLADPNEVDWVDRYHEHLRQRAAGEVGPIKTIPKLRPTPISPAGQIPALDPCALLLTSKVWSESAAVARAITLVLCQAPGPPPRRHRPGKETAQPSKNALAASPNRSP